MCCLTGLEAALLNSSVAKQSGEMDDVLIKTTQITVYQPGEDLCGVGQGK